jgi:hypothetical protein
MLMSLLLALNALACIDSDDPRAIGGEGNVINPWLPLDCIEVVTGAAIRSGFERKQPDVREYVRQVADDQRRGLCCFDEKPPVASDYIAVRVYQRVDINDPNTLRFLGWQILSVSQVKYFHDPKNLSESYPVD